MQSLNTYLNDHLAGSVGALELLDNLLKADVDEGTVGFLTTLRANIEADQVVLSALMGDLGWEESSMRKAAAWMLEKLSRAKLQPANGDDAFSLLQALESLCLGIWGKRALWRNLAAAAASTPELRSLDYDALERRAVEQFERVETKCLELATATLRLKERGKHHLPVG